MGEAGEPVLTVLGDDYYVLWPSQGLAIEFTHLHDRRDELTAEIRITDEHQGDLHWGRINLASVSGRTASVKALEATYAGPPWRRLLDVACQRVAAAYRESEREPAYDLVPLPESEARWVIPDYIPADQITVLFGDAGAGKSYLALGLAIFGILGHPFGGWSPPQYITRALYLDWESDRRMQGRRLERLTALLEPWPTGAIKHLRLHRPLTEELTPVKRLCAEQRADFVICDSLGAACGPEPETADAAVRTLQALSGLPGTKLVLAHVSKASADQPHARPFGSVYVRNLARSTIEARRMRIEGLDNPREMVVSLRHDKPNESEIAAPTAIKFSSTTKNGPLTVTRADPDAKTLGAAAQILDALRAGRKSVPTLAEELDLSEANVRAQLSRLRQRNKVVALVSLNGGRRQKHEWGLIDTQRNNPVA